MDQGHNLIQSSTVVGNYAIPSRMDAFDVVELLAMEHKNSGANVSPLGLPPS